MALIFYVAFAILIQHKAFKEKSLIANCPQSLNLKFHVYLLQFIIVKTCNSQFLK